MLFHRSNLRRAGLAAGLLFASGFSVLAAVSAGEEPGESVAVPEDVLPAITRQVAYPGGGQLYELSNGLTVFVLKQESSPIATVRAYVRQTGSQNEERWLGTGISHFVEHLVCGGTTSTRSKQETTAIIDSLGGASNAATGKDYTCYYIDTTPENLPTACGLIADWLQNCVFHPEEFQSEKGVILQELLDAENNPMNVASDLLSKTIYQEHPRRHPIGGYPELFKDLTLDDVKAFYQERYTPNQTYYIVAGNVDPDAVASLLAEAYRNCPRARETYRTLPAEPVQISPREAVREMDVQRFQLYLAWPTISLTDPDLFALDTLATILSEGEGSRLNRRVKLVQGFSGNFGAYSSTPASLPGYFLIYADTAPEELAAAGTAIEEELRNLAAGPVPPEELAKAKKLTESAFVYAKESLSNQASSAGMNLMLTGNPDFDTDYLNGIRAVTAEDILRVAQTYFSPARMNRVLIAPKGMAPKPVAADSLQNDQPVQAFKLQENGIRVLVKRTSRLPKVNMQVYMLGGSLAETEETAGIGSLLAEMLGKGSAEVSRTEFEDYFDSIGGSVSFSSARNTLSADMTVLKEDFTAAAGKLADALLRPAFPAEELDRAKKNQLARIARRSASPMMELADLFTESLPASTPYHLAIDGTPENVARFTAADLSAHHARLLQPENMIVTVFGDINPEETVQQISALFGVVASTGTEPISFDRHNELLQEPDRHKKTEKEVGTGLIAWPTTSIHDVNDTAALTVLSTLLGGYRYPGGRLFQTMRMNSLVYRLSVYPISGPAPGYMLVTFESAPDKIGEIFSRIDTEIERIKNEEVSAEEIEAAKNRIIAYHPQEMETDSSQAQKGALDELYGLGFRNEEGFNDRIRGVTPEDIFRVARKYFNQRAVISTSPLENR